MDVNGLLNLLNKKSGVQGLSGISSDFRDIDAGIAEGNPRAKLAFDSFCYSAIKLIGGYVAAMNGVDLIAFTAGIGENDAKVRATVLKNFGYLGITLDEEVNNATHGKEAMISTADSKVKAYVIPTNEELAIARDTAHLVK